MNEAMTRELLRELADGVPGPDVEIPRRVAARARRRMAFTVGSIAVVGAVVAAGAFTGVRSLSAPLREQPADQPPTTQAPAEVRVYTSARYGYSIVHPADWRVRPSQRRLNDGELPWVDGEAVDAFNSGNLVVAAQKRDEATTLETWTADTVKRFHAAGGCAEPTSTERIRVGGEPARFLSYGTCFGYHHLWVTVLHEKWAFHIVWLSVPGNEAADRIEFIRILQTFRFET